MNSDFCLASQSERRIRLLSDAGFQFDVRPAAIAEQPGTDEPPEEFARRMATAKAQAVSDQLADKSGVVVLGADTDVSVDGRILGKPSNRKDAADMLMALKGRSHRVYSAVALRAAGRMQVETVCTEVIFGDIPRADAEAYWDTGEPCDKAGGYAVQGLAVRWIREIRGSLSGVVGLPLYETIELLRRNGIFPRTSA